MLRFYIKLFIRYFWKFRIFNLINIFGLALGLSAVLMIGAWIHFHLSYESFIPNQKNLFRVVQTIHYDDGNEKVAPTPSPLGQAMMNSLPGIKRAGRLHYGKDLIMRTGKKTLVEQRAVFADSILPNMLGMTFIYAEKPFHWEQNTMLLSETAAMKYFGTLAVLGESLRIENNKELLVSGVFKDLPENSHLDFSVMLPLDLAIEMGHEIFPETWHSYDEIYTYVETYEGADIPSLNEKIRHFKSGYVQENQDELILQPLDQIHTETGLRYDLADTVKKSTLFTFAAVASLLLLIALFNYVIFTIALSSSRLGEMNIRKIHGSSRAQILGGHVLEALILAALSLTLSLVLIEAVLPFLDSFFHAPLTVKVLLGSGYLWYVLALLIMIGVVGGLIPGMHFNRIHPVKVLQGEHGKKLQRNRLMKTLIIMQFAISLALMVFSFTMHAQIKYIENHDTGVQKDHLISIRLFEASRDYLFNHLDQVSHDLTSVSGVRSVSFACSAPAWVNTSAGELDWEGKTADEHLLVQWNSVFYNYFETIGVDLVAGRGFSENFGRELADDQHAVFILNEKAVKDMNLDNRSVLGRNITLYGKKGPVIGVVRDYHFQPLHENISPMAFFMHPFFYSQIIIRTGPVATDVLAGLEKAWHDIFPEIPFEYTFANDQYEEMYRTENELFAYNTFLSMLMIIISALGLSSVAYLILYNKTREIGIRKINGASGKHILIYLTGIFAKWIFLAIVIGLPTGIFLTQKWLNHFAYRTDGQLIFYLLPVGLLMLISMASILTQVTRSARTNPVDVLRHE